MIYMVRTIFFDISSFCFFTLLPPLGQEVILFHAPVIKTFDIFIFLIEDAIAVTGFFQQFFILIIQVHDMLKFIPRMASAIPARIGKVQHLITDPIFFINHLPRFNFSHLSLKCTQLSHDRFNNDLAYPPEKSRQGIPFDSGCDLNDTRQNEDAWSPVVLYPTQYGIHGPTSSHNTG